jgi:hypothetical protein
MMKRSTLVAALILCILSDEGFGQRSEKAGSSRPNIVWIVANDISPDLACNGNKLVNTPNLDQLAREGVIFQNLYTVGAVCSPSRSGLITGMYPVSINSHNQFTKYKKPLPAPIVPVTDYFRKSGYFVANSSGIKMDKTKYYTGIIFSTMRKIYSTARIGGKDRRINPSLPRFILLILIAPLKRILPIPSILTKW